MTQPEFELEPPAIPLFDATKSAMAHQIINNILLQQRDQIRQNQSKEELTFLTVKAPVSLRRNLKKAARLLRCTQTDLVLEPLKIILPLILANQNQIR